MKSAIPQLVIVLIAIHLGHRRTFEIKISKFDETAIALRPIGLGSKHAILASNGIVHVDLGGLEYHVNHLWQISM